ncbi:MAG: Dihydroorotate dehydrogenase 2 [Candidatus Curtissbacteria bacterium GW2011_GWD1_40_8]|nr:MAG: Dihydroorotate dehydrogenase 2 [Candidatus Curtissbacteria bacterium GW2011_GWD1_40_8]KKS00858.1 MAG: Dihydroorotate dehydrogenase 2 [Candidatus Curtissbacteria bacterium GW2011_GWC2_41_21]
MHDSMVSFGVLLGKYWLTRKIVGAFFSYSNKTLEQKILGIKFKNPIGLGAGFDKDAVLVDILPYVGFGFVEVGSITGEPCSGNPRPRLWRLKKSKGLVVNYGLKNEGCEKIAKRLLGKKFQVPVGISIAKTNSPKTVSDDAGINDYVKAFGKFVTIGDYFTINISCPNAFGGQPFTDAKRLDKLIGKIDKISTKKPIFLKISPDLTHRQVDRIIEVSKRHKVDGFVCTNLTSQRNNKRIVDRHVSKEGGISGKVVEEKANDLISYIYKKTKGRYVIIGLGGVFSAEDAYKKIKLGASLVQLITGMIFEGPQVISEINQGVVKLLKTDGLENVSQAIGVDRQTIDPTSSSELDFEGASS